MAWDGYFAFGGNEIINVARTEAYAASEGASWLRPQFKIPELAIMLGDAYYRSPMQDHDVPWADPNDPDSFEFYGMYPLTITGIEDSTRISEVTESLADGGNTGRLRNATRAVVFSCILIGSSEAAVDSGMKWLKQALLTEPCGSAGGCGGDTLCYLSGEPAWDGFSTNCTDDYIRTLTHVQITTGPTVTAKNKTADGSAIWTVTFTAVAGNPSEFGPEVPIASGLLVKSDPLLIDGGTYDETGSILPEVKCPTRDYFPIFDPSFLPLTPPPTPPSVALTNFKPPSSWQRNSLRLPTTVIPLWDTVVPKLDIHTGLYEVRNLRFRFYADANRELDPDTAYCGYCLDFVVSYIPPSGTFTIDCADRSIYFQTPGGERQRADSLVFSSDGTPFDWPELTCGIEYLVTIDTLRTQRPPSIDLSLISKAA